MDVEICERPVFVLGAPRSGTSMMQWALRQHPHLWGGQESDYLIPLYKALRDVHEFGSRRERLHWLSGQKVSYEELLRHVGYGINSLYMSRSGGLRWVEQTPQYTLHLDAMRLLFPDAQFLFMLRDGRAVVQSLRKFVNPVEHAEACKIWQRFVEAGRAFAGGPHGDAFRFVSYEGAVRETETELRAVFDFIDEPYEAASTEFITSSRPINSSFSDETSSGQKLAPRWAGWTAQERRTFHEIAGETLIEMGFEEDSSWVDATPVAVDEG